MSRLRFPEGFLWGAASAATGQGAATQDVELLGRLGLSSYRFGVPWPRVQPEGRGPARPDVLDAYRTLVDGLLAAGIRPLPVLHQGELPDALARRGGWADRDTAGRFADYASALGRALADRVDAWLLLDAPSLFLREALPERRAFLRGVHVANLAQAAGAEALRAERDGLALGAGLVAAPAEPEGDGSDDEEAFRLWRAGHAELFLGPAQGRGYPPPYADAEGRPVPELEARDGDGERCLGAPDFLSVRLAPPVRIRARDDPRLGHEAEALPAAFDASRWPETVCRLLQERFAGPDCPPLELVGLPCLDDPEPEPDGALPDEERLLRLRGELEGAAEAVARGVELRAYHAPHLLDIRDTPTAPPRGLGLVALDPETDARTPRRSATWLQQTAAENGFEV